MNNASRFFVRDDDVGALTDELRSFVEVFLDRGIPVSYQIIPARLTSECAAFLLATRTSHPDLIEFGQHGLHHQMTVRGRALKREFGPERPYAQQSADIKQGLATLERFLGDAPQVFTPPQHKFDRSTVLAAAAAGHRVFSASCYSTPHHRLAYWLGRRLGATSFRHHGVSYHGRRRPEAGIDEISIAVAVDNGRSPLVSPSELRPQIDKALRHTDVVGLMFHHAIYVSALRSRLVELADGLAAIGRERFALLGPLAACA